MAPHKYFRDDLLHLAQNQAWLLSRKQITASGISDNIIASKVNSQSWQRVVRGVYNIHPGDESADSWDLARKQSAWAGLLAIPGGISSGVCALALHGVWGLPRRIPPEVCFHGGGHRKGPPGITIRRFRSLEIEPLFGRYIASPIHALAQALPTLTRYCAVSVLDSALNRKFITPDQVHQIDGLLRGRPGADRARAWLLQANALADSPFETRVRLKCQDAGLPPAHLQVKVWDEVRGCIAHGDLGWKRDDGTWLLVDLDGKQYHDSPRALLVDRRRQNAIALAGRHTHLRFAWADLKGDLIPRTIARALNHPNPTR